METRDTSDQWLNAAELGHCLGAALADSPDAMALLERESGLLLWCSRSFARQFADARIGTVWQPASVVSAESSPANSPPGSLQSWPLWQATCQQQPGSDCAQVEPLINVTTASDEQVTLSIRCVSERCNLVRSWPPGTPSRQLHQYLQARNDLLVTASTLSVSEMATSLAHEINQPVGTITNLLQGIKSRLRQDPPQLDTIDTALDKALVQARFTASVISRIRDFTQERRPNMVRHDARSLIREAFHLLDWLLSNQACRHELDWPSLPVWIVCDATLFQQVIINLVRNAVEAMHETPVAQRVLTVKIESRPSEICIAICDRGHGLLDGRDSLFIPFATCKPDGMGVGLNICRSFIELHEGRLWLTPNPDTGCTAWISLPAVQASASSEENCTSSPAHAPAEEASPTRTSEVPGP